MSVEITCLCGFGQLPQMHKESTFLNVDGFARAPSLITTAFWKALSSLHAALCVTLLNFILTATLGYEY